MVFSPGMSWARTMAYSDQGMWGANAILRMRPRAMVERMVQPCHMLGRVRSSMYWAAPRTLARPSLRGGEVPMMGASTMGVRWGIDLVCAGFGVSDEDSTSGGCGAMGGDEGVRCLQAGWFRT